MAVAFMVMTNTQAQKQVGGDKNFEFTFAPWGDSPIGITGIRLRSFNGDGTGAIRLGLWLGGSTTQMVNTQPNGIQDPDQESESPELLDISKSFDFSIRPGYEKHFDGTDRLSPYIGAELIFGMGSETWIREYFSPNDQDQLDDFVQWDVTEKQGTTTIGFDLIAGFDYYWNDNIYCGAEMYFGLTSTTAKDMETTVGDTEAFILSSNYNTAMSDFWQAFVNTDGEVEYSNIVGDGAGGFKWSSWGPMVQGTIRLGVLIN